MSGDWFRNTTWDGETARHFEAKLKRARKKSQYLRIQACTLARTHPEVALELLDRYFALADDVLRAQAYVDRATALRALGKLDESVAAYELALAREAEVPNVLTQAYVELPYIIATARLESCYSRALEVLARHEERPTFPLEHFRWHAARALILAAQGDAPTARSEARAALEAASRVKSGFRYHQGLGLVGDQDADTRRALEALRDA